MTKTEAKQELLANINCGMARSRKSMTWTEKMLETVDGEVMSIAIRMHADGLHLLTYGDDVLVSNAWAIKMDEVFRAGMYGTKD